MKIVAPISKVEEVAPLAAAGADEFYCGVVPAEWTARFNSAGVNRRIFGNLGSYEDLAAAIAAAHAQRRTISLVLNAPHYGAEQMAALLELAGRFASLGGDALIVGDIGLLGLLAAEGPGIRLHVSSLLACRNAEAAALYHALGARRIVLPRDVALSEMAAMVAANPGIEFEAFILNDGCVFEEGSCHTIHLPGRLGGPICLDRYEGESERVDGRPLAAAEREALTANETAYGQWLWYRFGCGFSTTEDGYPYGPCGLCALPFLAAQGVGAVKIAGREANLPRKLKCVEMVAAVRERVPDGASAIMEFARGLRRRPDLCATGYMCYYREVLAQPALDPAPRPRLRRSRRSPRVSGAEE